jgi:hypothetical protein
MCVQNLDVFVNDSYPEYVGFCLARTRSINDVLHQNGLHSQQIPKSN